MGRQQTFLLTKNELFYRYLCANARITNNRKAWIWTESETELFFRAMCVVVSASKSVFIGWNGIARESNKTVKTKIIRYFIFYRFFFLYFAGCACNSHTVCTDSYPKRWQNTLIDDVKKCSRYRSTKYKKKKIEN